MSALDKLYDLCLKTHLNNNDHHPEFFADADREMPLDARIELTCDLLSCVKTSFKKKNISVSLATCRAIIESQKWKNWKFAVLENLPPPSTTIPTIPERWKQFSIDEKLHLKTIYEIYQLSNRKDILQVEIKKLDCVKFYLEDLHFHKQCIYEIWKEIPEFNTPQLEKRILAHDSDKFETLMILGYTAFWCF